MYLQITLGEDHGSGHFYLARNRTFLLCVDNSRWKHFETWRDPFCCVHAGIATILRVIRTKIAEVKSLFISEVLSDNPESSGTTRSIQ
jgi:hypothetical protein